MGSRLEEVGGTWGGGTGEGGWASSWKPLRRASWGASKALVETLEASRAGDLGSFAFLTHRIGLVKSKGKAGFLAPPFFGGGLVLGLAPGLVLLLLGIL